VPSGQLYRALPLAGITGWRVDARPAAIAFTDIDQDQDQNVYVDTDQDSDVGIDNDNDSDVDNDTDQDADTDNDADADAGAQISRIDQANYDAAMNFPTGVMKKIS
jgi:hypothetical protein